MKRPSEIIILLIAVCLYLVPARAQTPPTVIELSLGGEGRRETVVLDREKDPAVSVRRGRKLLWQGVPGRWQPWKLMVADVDGDGQAEIIVGVHKATRYFPQPHNCLFVYSWDGRRAAPKWLGSTLSKPFTDFTFADLDADGHKELVAVEILRDGRQSVGVYSWNGFGFTLDRQRGAWRSAKLTIERSGEVVIEADGARVVLGRD